MTTFHTVILVVHVLIAVLIVGLVLMQRGKGAEAGAAFGAGASGTMFGARGSANFLSRSTAVLASLFFATSLGLAYLGTQRQVPQSLLDAVPSDQSPVVTGLPELPVNAAGPPVETSVVPGPAAPVAELPPMPAPTPPKPAE